MYNNITNYFDNNNVDLGKKLVSKDYLLTYYPDIFNSIATPELWTWGSSGNGQLGVNDNQNRSTPVTTFAGGANWKQISCGRNHSVAIKTDGTLWTWGWNNTGQLGINDTIDRSTPVTTFAGGTDWKQVSGGQNGSSAIKVDGSLWTWGLNNSGQRGDNTITTRSTPVTTFIGGNDWKQVCNGYRHVAAIKTDGSLWLWGRNTNGQLGINDTNDRSTPVTTFAGGTDWKQIECFGSYTAGIKVNGTLWTWGLGSSGQLAINDLNSKLTPVTTFAGGINWKQVSCGYVHGAAVKTDGTLWTWGGFGQGRLGNNLSVNVFTPVTTFAGGTNWYKVDASRDHTAAIKTDGTLWLFGWSSNAQIGDNTGGISRSTPVTTFAGGTNWKQISCGDQHTAAIKSIDTV